jgi:hypothetical protein
MAEKDHIPYRQIHLDFHTSPLIDGIGERFNKEEFVTTLKKAHVNSINLFTKCHHGMFYYPTEVGTMHPHLKFDLFGAQMEACRENGIRAIAYSCVGWNEDWADRHPEWMVVDYNGLLGHHKPFDNSYYGWRCLCYNHPDYHELLKKEYQEICDRYHPDGFWIDIIQAKDCVCPHCSADMKKLGLDPQNYMDVKRFNKISETKFCQIFYDFLKSIDPNLEIYFNSFPYALDNGEDEQCSSVTKRRYFDFLDIESLPSDEWGYSHFPVAVNYLNHGSKEICMMNGKFHMAWGDFGSLRHENALEYECFRAIANGAKLCVGDQLHPSGKLDPVVYERIGKVFEQVQKMEPWLHGTKKVSDIGVLIPSEAVSADPSVGELIEEGVYRVLSEQHMLFDFVNCQDDFSKYRLLIVPDHAQMSAKTANKIDEYVKSGGKILVTGDSSVKDGVFQISSVCAEYQGASEYDVRYLRTMDEDTFSIPQIDHVLYNPGYCVKAKGAVLAGMVNPYFSRTYEHFCSHRQTPPQLNLSGDPAVIEDQNGIYVAAPLFTSYAQYGYTPYRDLLGDCIRRLMGSMLIVTDLPSISEVTLREREDGMVLHLVNYVIQRRAKKLDTVEEKYTVTDRVVSVETSFAPSGVLKLPDQTPMKYTYAGGKTTISIDRQEGYTAYWIQK